MVRGTDVVETAGVEFALPCLSWDNSRSYLLKNRACWRLVPGEKLWWGIVDKPDWRSTRCTQCLEI